MLLFIMAIPLKIKRGRGVFVLEILIFKGGKSLFL